MLVLCYNKEFLYYLWRQPERWLARILSLQYEDHNLMEERKEEGKQNTDTVTQAQQKDRVRHTWRRNSYRKKKPKLLRQNISLTEMLVSKQLGLVDAKGHVGLTMCS